jgi:hypothetical protein
LLHSSGEEVKITRFSCSVRGMKHSRLVEILVFVP